MKYIEAYPISKSTGRISKSAAIVKIEYIGVTFLQNGDMGFFETLNGEMFYVKSDFGALVAIMRGL